MQSLFTPVTPTPMGAAINGTNKPYRKIIYDIAVDATLDQVSVSLAMGCQEDEDWTDDETYNLEHNAFEKWLDKNDKLSYDDTHYVAAHDGEGVEMGEAYAVSYTEYLMDHINDLDIVAYMKEAKIIPDYIIDHMLIQIKSI